jgi:predicted dehydrogenase
MSIQNKPFKLAFIGGSLTSAVGYTHYIASRMDNLFSLEAGAFSRDKIINEQTANAWGVEKNHTYSCWKTLLHNEINNIDVVVILTPTPSHHEMIMLALNLGYAVISEKALASTSQEGSEIVSKIKEKNAFFAVTHNYTGYPMLRELQDMILTQKLGEITNINIEMPQESFARLSNGKQPSPQQWRLNDKIIPGVSLDLGTHLQHLIYFLVHENPSEIVADQTSMGWFDNVIDNVACLVRYPSGMRCQMWYGKAAIGHRNGLRIRIYGTKGSAEWFQMNPEELIFHTVDGDRMIIDRASNNVKVASLPRYNRFKAGHPAGFVEAFANIYMDVFDKFNDFHVNSSYDIEWSYTAEQANIGLKVFEAIQISSTQNKWVSLGI